MSENRDQRPNKLSSRVKRVFVHCARRSRSAVRPRSFPESPLRDAVAHPISPTPNDRRAGWRRNRPAENGRRSEEIPVLLALRLQQPMVGDIGSSRSSNLHAPSASMGISSTCRHAGSDHHGRLRRRFDFLGLLPLLEGRRPGWRSDRARWPAAPGGRYRYPRRR